ncbi:MAG TPA: hypothetical protein VFF30_18125 [Nitrososphaerales archaeon]|nr:hypothetical protein [Nitrososphaerales archaeon]
MMKTSASTVAPCYYKLASKLLSLDDSVVSATIASPNGELLSVKCKPSVEELKPSKELLDKAGPLVAVVSSLMRQAESFYGGCKYMIVAYGILKVAVIPIKGKSIVVALGTTPEAPARKISLEASKLAGL